MGLLERIKSALGFGTSGTPAAGESSTTDRRSGTDPDSTGEPTPVEDVEGDEEVEVAQTVVEPGEDDAGEDEAGVDVTVEHEPDTRSEDAVKGTDTADTGSSADVEPADTGDAESEETSADEGAEPEDAEGTDAGDATAEPGEGAERSPPGEGVDLEEVKGIGPAYADRLRDAGIEDVAALAAADAADLAERSDMGEGRLEKLIDRAKSQ